MTIKRNLLLMLIGVLLISFSACSKKNDPGTNSGNVTGNGSGSANAVDPPGNSTDGVVFINSGKSAIFNLYAPGKKSVILTGDFNNWSTDSQYAMKNSKDGTRWWIQIDNLDPTVEYAYQYFIDGSIRVADPYTHKILDPDNDKYIPASVYPNLKAYPTGKTTQIVSVTQGSPAAYTWKTTNFTRPDPKNLVVYELLPRDFVATHSYQTLTDTLNYMVRLGVNAIELLPVNEFEGNDSWGYNTNFMFALDKYYGTPNDYKAFIDACHAHGIAVIQDIVLEDQFGSSPMVRMYAQNSGAPSSDNPWLDPVNLHPDAVGYQMNQQSTATQYYVKNVIKYWLQEYHIDGYRFDQSKGFTQTQYADEASWSNYDAARIATLKDYYNSLKSVDPTAYLILEHFCQDKEEGELAAAGMILWNNLAFNAEQATMSYNDAGGSWDLSRLFYDSHSFPSTSAYNLMGYFESHDEERMQYKNEAYGNSSGTYNTRDIPTGLKRDEMAAAFLFSVPGPKMLWQFGERGYDITIGSGDQRTADKPPHWEYMSDANRAHLFKVYQQMINWKKNNAVFTTTSFTYTLGTPAVKSVQLKGTDNNVVVVGNFDVNSQVAAVSFPSTGSWYDNFTGTTLNVTSTSMSMTLAPGEYHLYSTTPLK